MILKFAEGSNIRLRDGNLVSLDSEYRKNNEAGFDTLKDILKDYALKPEKGFPQPEEKLDNSRRNALKKGIELADMNLYYDFRIDPDAVDAEEVINRLNRLDIVETAYAPGVYFGADIIQDEKLTDNLLSYDYVLINVR